MNYYFVSRKYYDAYSRQFICISYFLALSAVLMPISWLLRNSLPIAFHALLFVWGWLGWTFVEYMSHRFWMHGKAYSGAKTDFNHMHHHSHPTEIRVKPVHRIVLGLVSTVLTLTALHLQNYFTMVNGFFFGFTLYFYMHYFLHQAWASKFIGRLQDYHIYHHCKYPNRCFGVTITWWDRVFKTTPPMGANVPKKTRDFYFGRT